jgi:hypothetical protein
MPYTNEQINTLVNNLSGGAQGYNPNSPTTGYLTPTRTVDATTIGNQTPIQIPPTTIPTSNGVADATNFQLNPPPQQGVEDIVNQGTKPGEATLGYQGLIDRLKAGYSQITGRSAEQQKQNEAQGVNALTADLSGLDTQIFSLVNKANQLDIQSANVPNVVQQSIQGQGVTKAGSAVRTADELRRIAIQKGAIASDALTLESAYYAKNNQLGLAKQKADEAVAAIYDPIQQQIDQQLKLLEVTKPFMEAEQKKQALIVEAKLNERQKNLDYAREDKQSVIALIGAAQKFYSNDPKAQVAIQEANKIDLTQPDGLLKATNLLAPFQQDPQAIRLQAQQIASARAQELSAYSSIETDKVQRERIAAETAEINQKVADLKAQSTPAAKAEAASGLLSLSNDILNTNDKDLEAIFGVKSLKYYFPGTSPQLVKNQVKQLIANLSLENRQKLKGSGAISDFEAKTLERAASALNFNLSKDQALKVIRQINGVQKTSSGGVANVLLKNPKDNTSQVVQADRNGINSAISDGLLVEYQ